MTSIRHAARQSWWLVAIVVAFACTVGLTVFLDHQRANQQSKDLQCVADWANAYAARAELILKQSNAKSAAADKKDDAADAVFRAVADRNAAQFNVALPRYVKASNRYVKARDNYNRAQREHPLPPAPKFVCSSRLPKPHAEAAAAVITRTVPVPGPTLTVGATRTVAAAGATATVSSSPRPGAVVTATRTRTVPGPTQTLTFIPAPETHTVTVTAKPSGPCVLIICLQQLDN